jgi:hypothetical protein
VPQHVARLVMRIAARLVTRLVVDFVDYSACSRLVVD